MSDSMRENAAYWRQCCQSAFFELDPIKLLERISGARGAILCRLDSLEGLPDAEVRALEDASNTLNTLQELAERDLGDQKKRVQGTHWVRMLIIISVSRPDNDKLTVRASRPQHYSHALLEYSLGKGSSKGPVSPWDHRTRP